MKFCTSFLKAGRNYSLFKTLPDSQAGSLSERINLIYPNHFRQWNIQTRIERRWRRHPPSRRNRVALTKRPKQHSTKNISQREIRTFYLFKREIWKKKVRQKQSTAPVSAKATNWYSRNQKVAVQNPGRASAKMLLAHKARNRRSLTPAASKYHWQRGRL